ncbi:late blight resistance protein R1-A-like [Solanum stenotomum]|uniref:late blight resistance protein R1-A-like n=1 Tax=Solanum stenotomum TaxID=172797 RepID=UPI0020D18EFC|nr:late blight resistance protein R1-A-like [Solanum stenotomum]
MVSAQLKPLIDEANDDFCEILSLLKNQGLTSETVKMISDVMKMIKPEIIAERFISPSKQSTSSSTRMITMDMVNLVKSICNTVEYLTGITFREFKHLGVLLKFTAKRCNIEHEKIKDLFTLAEDIAKTATYLSILCWETYDQYSARISAPKSSIGVTYYCVFAGPDFESKISKLLERINPIRPEWRKLYISFLKASHSSSPKAPLMHDGLKNLSHDLDLDLAQKFTESIRYDLEKLKIHDASLNVALSDRFEWLQDGLLHLSKFHKILDHQQQDLSSLLSFLEVLAIEAAIAIYSLCDMNLENNIAEVDLMFLPLQMKFKYLKLEISLFQKLRLPESQMDCFQEELTSMKTFLMDSLDKCKVQTQLTDVLTLVLSVTTEAESFTNSLSRDSEDGELARKINLLHFQLHLKFKFIREVICPFISASSTPVLPVIYPLNFLPTYVEAISSYFTMLKSSKTSPSAGSPTMDEVFMEFHEYIFENLLLKVEADLELTDTDKVKRFYHRLMPLVTLVVDPPMQYIECKRQNDLLRKIGTLAIEAEAAIRLSYEDALDRSKSRKVGLLLQLLTASFMLIKCEGKLMDQLKHKAIHETEFLDLVANAHEEIIFLRGFLMDLLRQHTTKIDKSDVLPLVLSVATEAHSCITSLSRDSEERELMRKINVLHFQLLLKFKLIKAAIRQICPSFSASTPDHHVIYPLKFLPTYFEVIDSCFTKLKSSSDSPKMDEVLLRFHEYIFENLLLKDEADLKLTDSDKLKRIYHSLLLFVSILVDPRIQYTECKKQNNLLSEIGALAIEAEAAICLSYEDSSQSNKGKKVNLLLQLLTVAFMLIKCKGKLTDQLKHKAILETELLNLVENANEELIFLIVFLIDLLGQQTIELNKSDGLLMHAEVAAHKSTLISTCSYESFVDGSSSADMSLSLSDFLKETKSVNAEIREVCFQLLDESTSYITVTDLKCLINMFLDMLNHLHSRGDVIPVVRNQILVVQEKLEFLADILKPCNMHTELKDLMERVQNVAYGEKYVIFFSVSGDSRAWFHLLYLYDVKQVFNFVEAEVKTITSEFREVTGLNFPKTNGLGFLNCFLGKLEELLHSKLDLITKLKPQIVLVKEGLLILRSFFDHTEETYDEHDEICGLIISATEMTYKAEYVIDTCLACSYSLMYKAYWISEVVENIKLVNKDVGENLKREEIDVNRVAKGSAYIVPSLSANTSGANEEMVGFQDVMDKLKKQLLGGLHQLDVISIFGMPGNGKTTLAKKIYNDPTVVSHFDVRAMCHVTQVYSWRDLLLTILNDVLEPADRTKKGDDELATELRRVLLTKRFLILIDDVWDKTAWDYLKMCFQGSQNRSRIILTTRLYEVADHAKCNSDPHPLRLLTDDESWKLLQEELFHGQSFPCELGDVGLRIAKRCGGLPLSIVLVAGVLKEKKKKADCWKEVEESLSSHNIGSSEESMSIIGFSYKNLPNHLKPCFLYFGGFLRGKDIPVSKLSRVWLAEGIVEDSKDKGSEDAAQDYLKDLIRKNLVTDMEKRSNGKLKTCRVHDLLHQFCVEKAKQDNFLFWIHRGHGVDSISYPEKPEIYRLSIYSKWDDFAQWQQAGSSVRSLLFNASSDDYYPSMARDISFIINRFKLVKVLNLESINIGDTFPNELKSLIHMRYFAVRTTADSIPSSVSVLWNLETFVVNGLHRVLKLPCSLFKMFKLRHVHVNRRASFSLHDNMCESQLVNLETFSTPCLSPGEDAEKILRSMPNLRKLRCIVEGLLGYSTKGSIVRFPRLDFLHQLESLKLLSYSYPTKHPHEFNFPLNLRELTLSNFRLPWTQIWTVGNLPNLEILKLLFRAFDGGEWEVKDSDFPELKYLKLDNLNIAEWSVMDDAFPKLERLVLTKCKKLKKIPCHFEDVASLNIEVNWCSWSVANSAQEFQTTQHEVMENYAFRVTIQPPDWDTRSSH